MSFFLTVALLLVLFVASELLRPKPKFEEARLNQLEFPTSTQGRVQPLVWGTCLIRAPNVVWWGDYRQVPIVVKTRTGLFTSSRQVIGFRYYAGIQFGLCRGGSEVKLTAIRVAGKEIWRGRLNGGDTLDINLPTQFGGDTNGYGGLIGKIRFHDGTASQAANAYLTAFQTDAGVTPRYQGHAYVMWEGGYLGNQNRIDPWEFEVERIPNGLNMLTPQVNTVDANPLNAAYELFTKLEWGYGFSPGDIDLVGWATAAETLRTEGNGFSMALESPTEAADFMNEIERQIDGLFFLDHRSGKWKITLARGGYSVPGLTEISPQTNCTEVRNFSRGTWNETSNFVRCKFKDRNNNYQDNYGFAIDTANAIMQGGGTVATAQPVVAEEFYPGVKNGELASALAFRSLRTLSFPLAKAELVVNKTLWDLTPYQVIRFTDSVRGIQDLPMRIVKIDYGELSRGNLIVHLVQDIFVNLEGSFARPPRTGWRLPNDLLNAFLAAEQLAFPAPRGFISRSDTPELTDRVWASGRLRGNASSFVVRQRNSAFTPSGSFADAGEGFGFCYVGSLVSDMGAGTATELPTVLVASGPSTQAELLSAVDGTVTVSELGRNLTNLLLIGDEFFLVGSAQASGGDVQLNSVYRAILDSGQQAHVAGSAVYFISTGGVLTDTTFSDAFFVDIKLLPKSTSATVTEASATTISFNMGKRLRRPTPPAAVTGNAGGIHPTSLSLEFVGSTDETLGAQISIYRRDYRYGDGASQEIDLLTMDASQLFVDFPTRNTTTHNVTARKDPNGTNSVMYTQTGITGQTFTVHRLQALRYFDGALSGRIRLEIQAQHIDVESLTSRNNHTYDFDYTIPSLAGFFNFGARDANATSAAYTASATGTLIFVINQVIAAGDVEYRLNGGSWTIRIAASTTNGSIAATNGDVIELRHTSGLTGLLRQVTMNGPSSQNGYFIFYS
jgi:hypothetical protein